ncbi:PD-(D/E)XK nuclease family protein [Silvibacterium acidisoli]|uniref:PD-(D/E)XK nuclease family protein n=1 Tax=Acidobacteriaceae bacterium ZG23-2 TaxID=2883246 RepID=UPI00406D16DB
MQLPHEIESAFASGAAILTANVRAAHWLRREYAVRQREAGRAVFASPAIESWDAFVAGLWQQQSALEADPPLVLTPLQERRVWLRMLRADAGQLVSPESMAALAQSAYALLSDYDAHDERRYPWGKTDADHFRVWAENFDRECSRQNWLSASHLPLRLAASLSVPLPAEIVLAGFERMAPADQGLLEAIHSRGTRIVYASLPEATEAEHICATDLAQEANACARFLKQQLVQNPAARLGVIVPDVGAVRPVVDRIFRRILAPASDSLFVTQPLPWEFSLGQPLGDVPLIRAALLLLRWMTSPLEEEEVTWLLLSGFLGKQADYLPHAVFDASLRNADSLSIEIDLADLLRRNRLPVATQDALKSALDSAARFNDERTAGTWADLVQPLLDRAGWPGNAQNDSLFYQAQTAWERLLNEVALLDFDGARISYRDFLFILGEQARETIFAPESLGAPIQVMGALEASGQHFDALWFLGADDQKWPARGSMHPLLPGELQRRQRMPYASPEADLEYAGIVTARILGSAPVVFVSYGELNADGEQRPSPLLDRTGEWQKQPEEKPERIKPKLETVTEGSAAIPWPIEQSAGGSEVIRDQAACPFRAFANIRLGAEPLNRTDWGLTPARRGSLLHAVLEYVWSPAKDGLATHDALVTTIREGELDIFLDEAIKNAFAEEKPHDEWSDAYLALEKNRLHTLLGEWLRGEAERQPFEVEATEQDLRNVNVGGLNLRLRADRIDRVGDGHLLIDYKTGLVSPSAWKSERPDEPQLPLYAVFGNVERVIGALFAQIRTGDSKFSGNIANAKEQLNASLTPRSGLVKEPYTHAMHEGWTSALLSLADEFLHGEARVAPKNGRSTCRYCALPSLCRIAELSGEPAEAGEVDLLEEADA